MESPLAEQHADSTGIMLAERFRDSSGISALGSLDYPQLGRLPQNIPSTNLFPH